MCLCNRCEQVLAFLKFNALFAVVEVPATQDVPSRARGTVMFIAEAVPYFLVSFLVDSLRKLIGDRFCRTLFVVDTRSRLGALKHWEHRLGQPVHSKSKVFVCVGRFTGVWWCSRLFAR